MVTSPSSASLLIIPSVFRRALSHADSSLHWVQGRFLQLYLNIFFYSTYWIIYFRDMSFPHVLIILFFRSSFFFFFLDYVSLLSRDYLEILLNLTSGLVYFISSVVVHFSSSFHSLPLQSVALFHPREYSGGVWFPPSLPPFLPSSLPPFPPFLLYYISDLLSMIIFNVGSFVTWLRGQTVEPQCLGMRYYSFIDFGQSTLCFIVFICKMRRIVEGT